MVRLVKDLVIAAMALLLTGTHVPNVASSGLAAVGVAAERTSARRTSADEGRHPRAHDSRAHDSACQPAVTCRRRSTKRRAAIASSSSRGRPYDGPFRLRAKDGDEWIVITSSGAPPKPGHHVQPSEAAQMPKLVSAGSTSSSSPNPARITTDSSASRSRRRPARS